MSSTPNPENEAGKPSNESKAVEELAISETSDTTGSDQDRSPGKTDRDIGAAEFSSDSVQSAKDVVTPESGDKPPASDGDRSPGKTDRSL